MSTAVQDDSWADPANYWADPAYLRALDNDPPTTEPTTDDTSPIDATDPEPDHPDAGPTLPVLPPDFWDARHWLAHVRAAAHARGRSADLVLHAALARVSAMLSPQLQVDVGLGPASLNWFVAAVAGSGVGKTSGARVARELLRLPHYLADPQGPGARLGEDGKPLFMDGLPLGTGEGMAEAFMGTVTEDSGDTDKRGRRKTEKRRCQVRRHAFFQLDEGESLVRMGERSGATIGPTIRSAWVGELLGQANASEDRNRVLAANSYSLGLLIGFQPTTAGPLLADAGPGTPQRFAWVAARDPNIPDHRTQHPGLLPVDIANERGWELTGEIQADPSIADELWQRTVAINRGDLVVAALDAHEPLWRAKLAALLMVLDGGDKITREYWDLAGVAWTTSCAVRDALLQEGALARRREQQQRTRQLVDERIAVDTAASTVPRAIRRVAEHLHRLVDEQGGLTTGAAWRCLSGRDRRQGRELLSAAMEYGAAEGWFLHGPSGLAPATVKPRIEGF